VRGDGDREHSRDRGAGDDQPEALAGPVGQRGAPGEADEPGIGSAEPAKAIVCAAEGDELRAPGNGFDELRRELPARGGLVAAPPRESRSYGGNDQPAD